MQYCFVGYVINEATNCQSVIGLWQRSSTSLSPDFPPSQSLGCSLVAEWLNVLPREPCQLVALLSLQVRTCLGQAGSLWLPFWGRTVSSKDLLTALSSSAVKPLCSVVS